jgi:hypothetical protein
MRERGPQTSTTADDRVSSASYAAPCRDWRAGRALTLAYPPAAVKPRSAGMGGSGGVRCFGAADQSARRRFSALRVFGRRLIENSSPGVLIRHLRQPQLSPHPAPQGGEERAAFAALRVLQQRARTVLVPVHNCVRAHIGERLDGERRVEAAHAREGRAADHSSRCAATRPIGPKPRCSAGASAWKRRGARPRAGHSRRQGFRCALARV